MGPWYIITICKNEFEAELIKGRLIDVEIPVRTQIKNSSALKLTSNSTEVYVPRARVEDACSILEIELSLNWKDILGHSEFSESDDSNISLTQVKKNEESEEYTKRLTYLLSAGIIVHSKFPSKEILPKAKPLPFANFGHNVLFDYSLFVQILSSVVNEIRAIAEKWSKKILVRRLFVIVPGMILLIATISLESFFVSALIVVLSLLLAFFSTKGFSEKASDEIADLRAEYIYDLLSGEWNPSNENGICLVNKEDDYVFGDGKLDGHMVPVLTVCDENPFPGYGRMQAENIFVCRPKKKVTKDANEINETVCNHISETINNLGIDGVTIGEIIVLHGDSLYSDSAWLDEYRAPVLWLSKNKIEDIEAVDERASVRRYYAAQIIFPDYDTAATFFIRIFKAGNSLSCQIAVSTLGPLAIKQSYILSKLAGYEIEVDESSTISKPVLDNSNWPIELSILREIFFEENPFVREYSLSILKDLDLYDEEKISNQEDINGDSYQRLLDESVMWPGYHWPQTNWREDISYTFTTDYFGRPEAISSVKTLYDQISRAILDKFDDIGFDISDYRSGDGKYLINADKIDQIIVGEKINVDQSKEDQSKRETDLKIGDGDVELSWN